MKITLVSRSNTWNDKQIKKEAKKKGIDLKKINPKDLNMSGEDFKKKFDNFVIWRSSSLDVKTERTTLLNILKKKNISFINRGIAEYPIVTHKLFQQKMVSEFLPGVNGIETLTFESYKEIEKTLKSKRLSLPFISKPNLGSQGRDVRLIKNSSDIKKIKESDLKQYVFQNFIKNDGDYRVIVIGGRPIGAIKRIAPGGSFLNNVSTGGKAINVKNEKVQEEIKSIASKVSALFNLNFCGIDIIFDKEAEKYFFLELNTVPQWEGFQKATKINVANELLGYCQEMKKIKSVAMGVQNYYLKHFNKLAGEKFHFCSRFYLWTKNKRMGRELLKMRASYCGKNEKEFVAIIKEEFKNKEKSQSKNFSGKKFRKATAKKYPLLGFYNKILFKNLMSKNLYNKDFKDSTEKFISDDKFLSLRNRLLNNERDLLKLSSSAINYLYLTDDYFEVNNKTTINPKILLRIAQKDKKKKKCRELLINFIYFITHCIIGESRFYKRKVGKSRRVYIRMLKIAEEVVEKNFLEIPLDVKFEILVCARLLDYKSRLEDFIHAEAGKSLSPIGNFLVDTLNSNKSKAVKKGFLKSEHRNVLYIMTNNKFKQR